MAGTARPINTNTILRPDLGKVAWEFFLTAGKQDFISTRVLPIFTTPEKSAVYPFMPMDDFIKIEPTKRASGAKYNRGGWSFSEGSYLCEEDGWEEPLGEEESAIYRRFIDAEMVSVTRAVTIVFRSFEKQVADLVTKVSNGCGSYAVPKPWTEADCTPLDDIGAAMENMPAISGIEPNTLIINEYVLKRLIRSLELKEYLKYTKPHLLDGRQAQLAMLASYFGIEQVLVSKSIMNVASKGKPKSIGQIWPRDIGVLARLSSGGLDLEEPALGRTFLWTEDMDVNPSINSLSSPISTDGIMTTEQYFEPQSRTNVYRVRHYTAKKIIHQGALYHLTGLNGGV